MEAIGRAQVYSTHRSSHISAPSGTALEEQSQTPPAQMDELLPNFAFDAPCITNHTSPFKTHIAPVLNRLSLIGLGLVCGFGSVVAQPVGENSLIGGSEGGNVKDKVETVVEKPQPVYDSTAGSFIAKSASNAARRLHSVGYCYRGVKAALMKSKISLTGSSAYMAANQLAKLENFKEIHVSAGELSSLQPGAIVVWSRTKDAPNGHVSIALGDGREASDHIEPQMTKRGKATFRVFIPVKDAPTRAQEPSIDFLVARAAYASVQHPIQDSIQIH